MGATESVGSLPFGQPGLVDVMRAAASAGGVNSWLKFFCGSKGFIVNRGGSVFDLEGGAVVRVRDRISLTGSYRLIGYDFRATGSDKIAPQMAGPFLGLILQF